MNYDQDLGVCGWDLADYGLNDILSSLDELLVSSGVKAEEKSRENMHLTGTETAKWVIQKRILTLGVKEQSLLASGRERLGWFL